MESNEDAFDFIEIEDISDEEIIISDGESEYDSDNIDELDEDAEMPDEHVIEDEHEHKLRATMVSYVPKKNRFVTLLSTYHTKKVIDVNDKKKPEIIQFYNKTKGAVDTFDEMVGTYRCKRKTLRWPLAVFENMLDISACNALVIFLANHPDWKHANEKARRRFFLIEVGKALTQAYIVNRKQMPRGKRALSVVNDLRGAQPDLQSPATSSANESTVPWLRRLKHTPPTKKRIRCHICPYKNNSNAYPARCGTHFPTHFREKKNKKKHVISSPNLSFYLFFNKYNICFRQKQ